MVTVNPQVKLTITEIEVRAQNRPEKDIATVWALEDPMSLIDAGAISDLCANTSLKDWISGFIDSYEDKNNAHQKKSVKQFFDNIVLPT